MICEFGKMGKHKNKAQSEILLQFMEEHADIARGFTKKDKPLVESLWQQLSDTLNSAGPPNKDVSSWKKIWTDWKSEVKKKLAQNQVEVRATGGGPFSKQALTQMEESIVRICSMAQSVQGVPGIAIGVNESDVNDVDDEMPSCSFKRPRTIEPSYCSTPRKPRTENTNEQLKKFLDEDNERKKEINKTLAEIVKVQKENASSLRRAYHAIEKGNETIANAVSELKEEVSSFSSHILRIMQERNDIKRKQVELELLKFDYEKEKNSQK